MSSKPLTLYSAQTPNGMPVQIALAELGVEFNYKPISIGALEQKQEWYLKINPNGRIPALVDHTTPQGNFAVFESSSILLYLADHYDNDRKISYDPIQEPLLRSEELQWMFFVHGGLASVLSTVAKTHTATRANIAEWTQEVERLLDVYDKRLQGHEYLVGEQFSLADIKTIPVLQFTPYFVDVEMKKYPNIQEYIKRCLARPSVQKGIGRIS